MNKLLLRIIASSFIFGLLCPSLTVAIEGISYQEIGDPYISSFGIVEVQKPKETSKEADKKKLDLTIPVLSEHEKRQLLFELMARNEHKGGLQDELITQALRITLKDLDIYYGNGKDTQQTLMSHINYTDTVFGEVQLAHQLAHPIADVSLLQKRQAFIKELVSNEELFNELDSILNQLKKAESGFFSFSRSEDPVTAEFFQKLYWSKLPDSLNKNSHAMETSIRLKNFGTFFEAGGGLPLSLAIAGLSMAAQTYIERRAAGENVSYGTVVKEGWAMTKIVAATAYNMVKNPPEDPVARQKFYMALGVGTAYVALILGMQIYQAKVAIGAARETRDAINYMQTRLSDVANIVEASKHLHAITRKNDCMAAGVFSINNLGELLYGSSRTEGFAELIDLLQTNTFKDSASFFSLSGSVLAGYRLMTDEKEHFAPALAAIGEIDACLSMAKLYKKMQHERVGYCFVDFVEHQKPSLNIVDFWNPFVDAKIVVTNSLELGLGADASKVILTGSNTGGKSTILKAIMMSLLMGHVFGMGPAKEMTLTPFAFIGSYLRVNDDTASGDSKFKAEVMRAKMLCETMDALPKNQFGFVVIDELFTGTGSEKASNAAGKVAQKLAGLENNLFILATHFPVLTELEKTNSGLIKNYKVDVFKDEAGNLIRPFKLEVGVSDSNIANDILQEQIQDIDFSI